MSNETNKPISMVTDNEIPIFASASAATSYKIGGEGFIDLIFLRPTFTFDQESETKLGESGSIRKTEMTLRKVSSVTLSEKQAQELIKALQDQLTRLETL
ncbi:TPA: hypothetical protein MCL96_004754 [Klebsiella pneumoniae]|uniref:hypothetical protein n=1 Tax=Klebsiella pneumoniae TaxID=573 RepID=UPI0011E582E8|nr:hypothetical protein [Klebsiella pneumoniae]HBS9937625.1 hypothetical protein [Klebsiella pneumoniae]HBT8843363.1 hypothetical protein [Klebsiella pneumoniae]HBT9144240.1 hypothetical protein [Klebsiella pneumoniae]HBU3991367.1 hypothetical protein [Klebsiella pneumoniae]